MCVCVCVCVCVRVRVCVCVCARVFWSVLHEISSPIPCEITACTDQNRGPSHFQRSATNILKGLVANLSRAYVIRGYFTPKHWPHTDGCVRTLTSFLSLEQSCGPCHPEVPSVKFPLWPLGCPRLTDGMHGHSILSLIPAINSHDCILPHFEITFPVSPSMMHAWKGLCWFLKLYISSFDGYAFLVWRLLVLKVICISY